MTHDEKINYMRISAGIVGFCIKNEHHRHYENNVHDYKEKIIPAPKGGDKCVHIIIRNKPFFDKYKFNLGDKVEVRFFEDGLISILSKSCEKRFPQYHF